MLTSIPVISPIEITIVEPGPRLLSAPREPDYEVHPLLEPVSRDAAAVTLAGETSQSADPVMRDPAMRALDEMEMAAQISEYHDFSWWDERIRIVRGAIGKGSG